MSARFRNSRAAAGLLALATAAMLAAGCGGGDASTTTDSAAAKEQYITAADAVCAKFNNELNAKITAEFGNQPTTASELSKFTLETTIPLLERQYKAFAAVPVPSAEQDQVDAINAAVDKALQASRDDPSAFFGGNGSPGAFDQANQLEAAFGFTQCGGGTSP